MRHVTGATMLSGITVQSGAEACVSGDEPPTSEGLPEHVADLISRASTAAGVVMLGVGKHLQSLPVAQNVEEDEILPCDAHR